MVVEFTAVGSELAGKIKSKVAAAKVLYDTELIDIFVTGTFTDTRGELLFARTSKRVVHVGRSRITLAIGGKDEEFIPYEYGVYSVRIDITV